MGPLAEAAKWVQWALGTVAEKRWEDARWNLQKFFALYESSPKSQEWNALAAQANYAQSLLAEHDGYAVGTGVLPTLSRTRAESEIDRSAAESARAAETARQLAALTSQRALQATAAAQGRYAVGMAATEKTGLTDWGSDILGVPAWGWAAALGLLVLVVVTK